MRNNKDQIVSLLLGIKLKFILRYCYDIFCQKFERIYIYKYFMLYRLYPTGQTSFNKQDIRMCREQVSKPNKESIEENSIKLKLEIDAEIKWQTSKIKVIIEHTFNLQFQFWIHLIMGFQRARNSKDYKRQQNWQWHSHNITRRYCETIRPDFCSFHS